MKSLFLKPRSRSRVLSGHPWVFAGEVQDLLPDSENGKREYRLLNSGTHEGEDQVEFDIVAIATIQEILERLESCVLDRWKDL